MTRLGDGGGVVDRLFMVAVRDGGLVEVHVAYTFRSLARHDSNFGAVQQLEKQLELGGRALGSALAARVSGHGLDQADLARIELQGHVGLELFARVANGTHSVDVRTLDTQHVGGLATGDLGCQGAVQ